jgi:myo-inositol-1(or 4)-monophosphatase
VASNPLFLTTAIEAVVRAGDLQMARFGHDIQIDKKGAIDLVTEVDVEVERMFRDLIAERFPDHQILAEEFGGAKTVPEGPCWVFDPIDGTSNYAHGLPIFCSSLALEIDGVPELAAVYDPNREELFTAERGGGAFLNGRPLRVSRAARMVEAMLVTGFPYDVHARVDESSACSLRSSDRRVPCGGWVRPRSICAGLRPGGWMDSGKAISRPGTLPAAR